MNRIAKEIKDYWFKQSPYFMLDSETLDVVSKSLNSNECQALTVGTKSPDDYSVNSMYMFTVHKAFNRHNDIIKGDTVIENNNVYCSKKSSITELEISLETMLDCNKHCIYHIEDVEEDLIPGLALESIADLTAAIIAYNNKHNAVSQS